VARSLAYRSRPIPNVTSSTARTAVEKLGRNWFGVALSLFIVAGVSVALWHLLRDIDAGKMIAAFTAQPFRNIVIAGVFVVLGYITLTFYDLFALHIIGRRRFPFASRRWQDSPVTRSGIPLARRH
jgi:uncharacterized membrane protein YbhN (UPF0104 family)